MSTKVPERYVEIRVAEKIRSIKSPETEKGADVASKNDSIQGDTKTRLDGKIQTWSSRIVVEKQRCS